jgi:hypothetical protein
VRRTEVEYRDELYTPRDLGSEQENRIWTWRTLQPEPRYSFLEYVGTLSFLVPLALVALVCMVVTFFSLALWELVRYVSLLPVRSYRTWRHHRRLGQFKRAGR